MKYILVLYAFFVLFFSVFTYLFIDPNFTPLTQIFSGYAYTQRLNVTIAYVVFIILFFIFYFYFLSVSRKKTFDYKKLTLVMFISSLLIFSYPTIISYDIFNYLATAKVTYFYFENPYLVMPIEFLGDPMLLYTRAANKLALYGPGWIGLTALPYYASFNNVIVQLFLFKLFVGIFYAALTYVIYKISKNMLATTLFALNPLILIETFVSGHNDIVMMFFAMLGILCLKEKKALLSFVFLIFSVSIKFATIFLIPIWIYILLKRYKKEEIKWNTVWMMGLVSMAVIFALSPIREEMYPWYFIWLLPFTALINTRKITLFAISFSAGLLLYYTPYMYTGYYLLSIKFLIVVFVSLLLFLCGMVLQKIKKTWDF